MAGLAVGAAIALVGPVLLLASGVWRRPDRSTEKTHLTRGGRDHYLHRHPLLQRRAAHRSASHRPPQADPATGSDRHRRLRLHRCNPLDRLAIPGGDPCDRTGGRSRSDGSLNIGCRAATGDVIAIVSAHVFPHVRQLAGRADGAVLGPRRGVDLRTPGRERTDEVLGTADHGAMVSGPFGAPTDARLCEQRECRHPALGLGGTAVRRGIDRPGGLDWAQRALGRGYAISYVATAPVVHAHDETWGQLVNRYRREAIAHRRIYHEQRMGFFDRRRGWRSRTSHRTIGTPRMTASCRQPSRRFPPFGSRSSGAPTRGSGAPVRRLRRFANASTIPTAFAGLGSRPRTQVDDRSTMTTPKPIDASVRLDDRDGCSEARRAGGPRGARDRRSSPWSRCAMRASGSRARTIGPSTDGPSITTSWAACSAARPSTTVVDRHRQRAHRR